LFIELISDEQQRERLPDLVGADRRLRDPTGEGDHMDVVRADVGHAATSTRDEVTTGVPRS
jgi:hypothetical protein